MSTRFTLQIVRVQCINEQNMEWGQDELRLIGFAISRKGHLFATGFRSLGSYGTGEVQTTSPYPMTLVQGDLEDDGLEVLFYSWLVEEDSGGVSGSAASIESGFREAYRTQAQQLLGIRFPRDCIPFTAFYKAVPTAQDAIDEAATDGINNDEVYAPVDRLLDWGTDGTNTLNYSREITFERSKILGHYRITLRYSYHREPVVFA